MYQKKVGASYYEPQEPLKQKTTTAKLRLINFTKPQQFKAGTQKEIDEILNFKPYLNDPNHIETKKIVANMQIKEDQFNTVYTQIQATSLSTLQKHITDQQKQQNDYFLEFEDFMKSLDEFNNEMTDLRSKASEDSTKIQKYYSESNNTYYEQQNILNQITTDLQSKENEIALLNKEFFKIAFEMQIPTLPKKGEQADQFLQQNFRLINDIYYTSDKDLKWEAFINKISEPLKQVKKESWEKIEQGFKEQDLTLDQINNYTQQLNDLFMKEEIDTGATLGQVTNVPMKNIESLKFKIFEKKLINIESKFFNSIQTLLNESKQKKIGVQPNESEQNNQVQNIMNEPEQKKNGEPNEVEKFFCDIFERVLDFQKSLNEKKEIEEKLRINNMKIQEIHLFEGQQEIKQYWDIALKNAQDVTSKGHNLKNQLQLTNSTISSKDFQNRIVYEVEEIQNELKAIKKYIDYDESLFDQEQIKKKEQEQQYQQLVQQQTVQQKPLLPQAPPLYRNLVQ